MKSGKQIVLVAVAVIMIFVTIGLIVTKKTDKPTERGGANGTETFSGEVETLVFEAGACEIDIVAGDTGEYILSYENLSHGTISHQHVDGELTITYKQDDKWVNNVFSLEDLKDQKITLTIPKDAMLEQALFEVGAAEITMDQIAAKQLYITVGAGKFEAGNLTATESAKLTVGAGSFHANDVDLMNGKLECGVGEMNLSGKLAGDITVDCGVGSMELELNEEQEEYHGNLNCGLGEIQFGNIQIDGSGNQGYGTSSAKNRMDIKCGLGEVDVYFNK